VRPLLLAAALAVVAWTIVLLLAYRLVNLILTHV
jgi:hypothetical protein